MEDIKVLEAGPSGVAMEWSKWSFFYDGELYCFYDGPENPNPPNWVLRRARQKGAAILKEKLIRAIQYEELPKIPGLL